MQLLPGQELRPCYCSGWPKQVPWTRNTETQNCPTLLPPQLPPFPPNKISIFIYNSNSIYKISMISDCISSAPRMTSSILKIIQSNDLSLISDTRLWRQELAILKNCLQRTHNVVASIIPDGSNKQSETLISLQKFCTKIFVWKAINLLII